MLSVRRAATTVAGPRGLPIAGHLEQVGADGVDSMVPRQRRIALRRGELIQARRWSVDHGDRDDAG